VTDESVFVRAWNQAAYDDAILAEHAFGTTFAARYESLGVLDAEERKTAVKEILDIAVAIQPEGGIPQLVAAVQLGFIRGLAVGRIMGRLDDTPNPEEDQ
jgi:hypothetical protein